jgi:hypothetical protein
MKKLYIFGDSFSQLFSDVSNFSKEYLDFKGYIPKTYSEIISEKLNLELKCYAKGGVSNRTILSQFISVLNQIEDGDVLIFNWSTHNRVRIVGNNGEIADCTAPIMGGNFKSPYNDFPSESVVHMVINRLKSQVFYTENTEYIKLIKKAFPNNKIIHWTWVDEREKSKYFLEFSELCTHYGPLEHISDETNGKINDHHYSENGHVLLSDILIKTLL